MNVKRAHYEDTQACGSPRQSIVRWGTWSAWIDATSTELVAVSHPSGLWQESTALPRRRFECIALLPDAQDNLRCNPRGRACVIWSIAFAAHCERDVPSSDGVTLVGCSSNWHYWAFVSWRHGRCRDEDSICFLAGSHILQSGLHRVKSRRVLARHGVRRATHRRTCVDVESDVSHAWGVQQVRRDSDADHCARCV